MKAEEEAKKIYWALMEAARLGEEMKIELTIIENGLKEYAQSQLEDRKSLKAVIHTRNRTILHLKSQLEKINPKPKR